MKRSLSVVLPVCNAERTLSDNLQHIFDILSDLTERFEVLVVDDGSTDQTIEVAHELSVLYPQLRVARRADRPAAPTEHESSLEQTTGDVVFLQGSRTPFSPSDARRMWELCDRETGDPTAARQVDAPSGRIHADCSGGGSPRPLTFVGLDVPQVGCIRVLRHPGEGLASSTKDAF